MIYTVGEMAQKLGVPASTLRYYDKEGLLPFVKRSSGGIRMFQESDFEWLQVIRCMKKPECPSKTSGSISNLPCRETTPLTPGWRCSGISERCSPSRSSSYSTRWRPWSINAGSTRLPKPPGRWMSPVRWPMRMYLISSVPSGRSYGGRVKNSAKMPFQSFPERQLS